MRVINKLFITGLALLLMAGCSTGISTIDGSTSGSTTYLDQPGDAATGLPGPQRVAAAATMSCTGSEFTDGLSRNVTAPGSAAIYSPEWQAAAPDPAYIAWAGYTFDMSAYTGADTIGFTWNQQGTAGDVWIGLSDYTDQCWDWYILPESGPLNVDLSAYTSVPPEQLQVMILCLGTAAWELAELRLGDEPAVPSAPMDVSASDGTYSDHVAVAWTASTGATSYLVYRDSQIAEVTEVTDGTAWDDTGLTDTEVHTYWVKARNASGDSDFSEADVGNMAAGGTAPAAPADVSASDGAYSDRVEVSWTASVGATSYLVYRDSQDTEVAEVTDGTAWDDTELADTDPHTYWVKARNGDGDSDFSNSDTGYLASGTAPDAPTGVRASDYLNDMIRIDWDYDENATDYEVYRDGILLDTTDGDTDYPDEEISDYDNHTYVIRTISAGGTSGDSAPATGCMIDTTYGPGDWPQYGRDKENTSCSPHVGPSTNNLRWTTDLRTEMNFSSFAVGFSSPVTAADGSIYIGMNYSALIALSPDGSVRWAYWDYMWDVGTPAIGPDGRIYFTEQMSLIRCIEPNGYMNWSYELPVDAGFSTHLCMDDNYIYAALDTGKVYKFDFEGNEPAGWPFDMSGESSEAGSPAVDSNGNVFVGTKYSELGYAYFHCIGSDGTELWNMGGDEYLYAFRGTPAVDDLLNCILPTTSVYSIAPSGAQTWLASCNETYGSTALYTDGSIYLGYEGNWSGQGIFSKWDSAGTLQWQVFPDDDIYSSPAVDADGNVYFGCRNGYVYAYNSDGTERWSYDTGARVDSSPAITRDGYILIGNDEGKVYCFGPAD